MSENSSQIDACDESAIVMELMENEIVDHPFKQEESSFLPKTQQIQIDVNINDDRKEREKRKKQAKRANKNKNQTQVKISSKNNPNLNSNTSESDDQGQIKKEIKKKRAAPPCVPASSSYSSSQSVDHKVQDRATEREKAAPPGSKNPESKKLYIGNLSLQIKEHTLMNSFEKYGSIAYLNLVTNKTTGKVRYRVMQSKGFGFVEFLQIESAIQAKQELDLQFWDNKKIRIQYCTYDS